jgi:hypothetical protein
LVIVGIREELRHAPLGNIDALFSSEKDVNVNQCGIGITALGVATVLLCAIQTWSLAKVKKLLGVKPVQIVGKLSKN